MIASFGNIRITNGSQFTSEGAQFPLQLNWNADPSRLYTIVFYDQDVPGNSWPNVFMHFLAVNIPGKDMAQGRSLIEYRSPHPPSMTHRYVIEIYQQSGQIPESPYPREHFPIAEFIRFYNLQLVGQLSFQVSSYGSLTPVLATTGMPEELRGPTLMTQMISPKRGQYLTVPVASGVVLAPLSPPMSPMSPSRAVSAVPVATDPYFVADNPLSERERAFCRCTEHVMEKRDPSCTSHDMGTKSCGNPFAICHRNIHVGNPPCSQYFNYGHFTDNELQAFIRGRGVPYTGSYQRDAAISAIQNWENQKLAKKGW